MRRLVLGVRDSIRGRRSRHSLHVSVQLVQLGDVDDRVDVVEADGVELLALVIAETHAGLGAHGSHLLLALREVTHGAAFFLDDDRSARSTVHARVCYPRVDSRFACGLEAIRWAKVRESPRPALLRRRVARWISRSKFRSSSKFESSSRSIFDAYEKQFQLIVIITVYETEYMTKYPRKKYSGLSLKYLEKVKSARENAPSNRNELRAALERDVRSSISEDDVRDGIDVRIARADARGGGSSRSPDARGDGARRPFNEQQVGGVESSPPTPTNCVHPRHQPRRVLLLFTVVTTRRREGRVPRVPTGRARPGPRHGR